MMSFEVIALFFAVLVIALVMTGKHKRKSRLPSGPMGYPILGNLTQLGNAPHLKVHQWAKTFGKMYTIYFLHTPVLVLNDAKLIKKLFGMMCSTGRFDIEIVTSLLRGTYGVGNSVGTKWLEQKQFFLKVIKQFGYGRGEQIEAKVLRRVKDFAQWMETEQKVNGNVKVYQKLPRFSSNLMWTMVTGENITNQESEIHYLLSQFMVHLQKTTKTGLTFFPSLKYVAPKWTGYTDFCIFKNRLHKCLDIYLETQARSRKRGSPPRNIIDAYMDQVKICQDPKSSFYGNEGLKHMFSSVLTLFLAGGDSTNMLVTWAMFYLTVNQTAQQKLFEEIREVVGSENELTLADRMNMPYMEAIILETLRLCTPAPMGLMHKLSECIPFEGYILPKGTLLMANIYHVHYDKNIWKDPENFRPERFLEDGSNLREYVIAFQPGKRSCPGESQAKDIMFLFIAKLIQQFKFLMDESVKHPREYLKPKHGICLQPPELPIVISKRICMKT